jgi:hypothetical protein
LERGVQLANALWLSESGLAVLRRCVAPACHMGMRACQGEGIGGDFALVLIVSAVASAVVSVLECNQLGQLWVCGLLVGMQGDVADTKFSRGSLCPGVVESVCAAYLFKS